MKRKGKEFSVPRTAAKSHFSIRLLRAFLGLACLILTTGPARAAGPAPNFVKLVGSQYGYAVASDSQGNIYVGTGQKTALIKLDPSGNRIWAIGVAPEFIHNIEVRGIAIDNADNATICGNIYANGGNISIGALNYNQSTWSTFFAKVSPGGNIILAKVFTNLNNAFTGLNVSQKPFAAAPDGSFVVAGLLNYAITYEGITVVPSAPQDVAVFKVNTDGSPIWARRGVGSMNDYVDGVATTSQGDIAVAGTSNSETFGMAGVIASASATKTLYLVKLDSQGNGRWAKAVASSVDQVNFTASSAVAYSPGSDSFIWAGDFTDSLNLVSPAIPSQGGKDVFLAKVSSAGTVEWAHALGGPQDQFASAAAVDQFGNIYVAGFFFGQMTIGTTTLTSRGLEDIYVAKFRDNGAYSWAKQVGWTGRDHEVALSFTRAGELLIAGTVTGGVLLDGVFVEGTNSTDVFVAKFRFDALPPRFATQPQSRTVSAGMKLTLNAALADPDPTVRYQWWFNGAPLTGETNTTLTFANAQLGQAGSYFLVASNGAGVAQSASGLISYTDAATLDLSVHPSLTIFGTVGRTYRIEYGTETRAPATWTIATNLTLNTTPQVWIDPTAALGEKRFYRVVLLP